MGGILEKVVDPFPEVPEKSAVVWGGNQRMEIPVSPVEAVGHSC